MFRFTIRDVLWLTVVVAVAISTWLAATNRAKKMVTAAEARELRQKHAKGVEYHKFRAAFRNWAREKGESVFLDVNGEFWEARPDGGESYWTKKPSHAPINVEKLRFTASP